jgi:hypothetical protein
MGTQSPEKHASWAIKLAYVRGFSRHLQAMEIFTEAPPVGLLPYSGSAKPYIYSITEIQALLEAALTLNLIINYGDGLTIVSLGFYQ